MKYSAVLLTFLLFGCDNETKYEMPKLNEKITTFTISEANKDLLKWELKGESAIDRGNTIVIYNFVLKFYQKDGMVSSVLQADSGFIFEETNNLKALGNVVVQSEDSTIVWTEELNWIEDKQKIQTESSLKYKKGEKVYTGKGMEADPDLKHIVIKNKFTGEGQFE
jgi:LPS export ABC transporter protein LptC